MSNLKTPVQKESYYSFYNILQEKLSHYEIKEVDSNKKVEVSKIETDYFMMNNFWQLKDIPFSWVQTELRSNGSRFANTYVMFDFDNQFINWEMKYFVYRKIEEMKWSLGTVGVASKLISLLSQFLKNKYPDINSITEIDCSLGQKEWEKFLKANDILTHQEVFDKEQQKYSIKQTWNLRFFTQIHEYILDAKDFRTEWEKDCWDVRNLPSIEYVKSGGHYLCRFDTINSVHYREVVKKYCKKRLLGRNKFKFGSCTVYSIQLSIFANYLVERHPNWTDFCNLTSRDMEAYLEYLNEYASERSANPSKYIRYNLVVVRTFLEDIQTYEWESAPKKFINSIIHADLLPDLPKKGSSNIKSIPDCVLEQLVNNFEHLPKDIRMIVLIMMQTGLRISDTLELKNDCLKERNGNYSIVADIQKTSIQNHEIPLVGDIVPVLKAYVEDIKAKSNPVNNPNNLLFNKFEGKNKTKPWSARGVAKTLNILANERNIVDEKNEVYHFKNHGFRHTFAVKMINNNMCLVLLQDILGHASFDMTLEYARLVDKTKQEEFKRVYEKGVFSYQDNSLAEVDFEEKLQETNWNWEWVHHKMQAINTPYGTCLQRGNGGCNFAKQPPCLTCNSGKPCKNLLISADDVPKYKIYIDSTKELIKQAELCNRPDWLDENKELLQIYNEIFECIKDGKLLFGNQKHLNAK